MNVVRPKNLGQLLREKLGIPKPKPARRLPVQDRNSRFDRFCDALRRKGWKPLDSRRGGCMCMGIFQSKDGTKILKISNNWAYGQQGDYYSEFVKWAVRQNSPHLPKFYKARSICKGALFLSVMERLDHIPTTDDYEPDFDDADTFRSIGWGVDEDYGYAEDIY